MIRARSVAMTALVAADIGVLVALRPNLSLIGHLRAPHEWVAAVGLDAAIWQVGAAALWLAAVWLAVGLAAVLASNLPGAAGQLAVVAARTVLPRALYQLAVSAAGVGVLLSPALAGAATPHSTSAAASSLVGTPAWPNDDILPPPAWPTTPATPTTAPTRAPASTPPTSSGDHGAPASPRAASAVVVHRGDSLWRIASRQLPGRPSDRRIAAAWPRWYAANRAAVGPDPDYIVTGQLLQAPTQEDQS